MCGSVCVRAEAECRRRKAKEDLSSEKEKFLSSATEEGLEKVKVLDEKCMRVCVSERDRRTDRETWRREGRHRESCVILFSGGCEMRRLNPSRLM